MNRMAVVGLTLMPLLTLGTGSFAADHPRIFFTASDIPRLREEARTTKASIAAPILAFATEHLTDTPLAAPPNQANLETYRSEGNRMLAFAFAYVLTGDRRYFELTRRYLLTHAAWDHWGDEGGVGQRDLGFHHMLMFNAIAYDWIYPELSAADRDTIRATLALRAEESYEVSTGEVEGIGGWWRHSYVQNHHWINNSALGIAALVLEGEDPRADTWRQTAAAHLAIVRDILDGISDGSWHEGTPYQGYGLTMSLPFLTNLRRLKDEDLIPHGYYQGYVLWRLYNTLPGTDDFLFSYGDFDWSWGNYYNPANLLRFAAAEYRDGRAEWTAEHIIGNARSGRAGREPYTAPWQVLEFLYYDPSVKAISPDDLPTDRVFPDLSGVSWRTDWGKDALIFGLKTGAYGGQFVYDNFAYGFGHYPFAQPGMTINVGHDHQDANTFYLYRGSTELSAERLAYHVGDTSSDTSYHNTLLVDGQGQYNPYGAEGGDPLTFRGTAGRLDLAYSVGDYSYVVAEAADRYRVADSGTQRPGARLLTQFTRHVLFVKPEYLVLIDTIRAEAPHRYDWVCHFTSSVAREGDWLRGEALDGQVLGVKVIRPEAFAAVTGNDGKPYVRVSPPRASREAQFVTLLYPTTTSGWSRRPEASVAAVNSDLAVVRVSSASGVQDHLINCSAGDSVCGGGYVLEGRVASVRRAADGSIVRLFLAGGRKLADQEGKRPLLTGDTVDQEVEVRLDGEELSITGRQIDLLTIYAPGANAKKVRLNGEPVSARRQGDYLVVGEE